MTIKMNNIITNTANTYVVTWPTEEIVESVVKVELNQLEEVLDDPEKNPRFDELTVPFTVLKKGVNAFETYWVTAAAISLLLLLHSIHEISNAPNGR